MMIGGAAPCDAIRWRTRSVVPWTVSGAPRCQYRADWERKRNGYLADGFVEGKTIFTARDDERAGLDEPEIQKVAEQIKKLVV